MQIIQNRRDFLASASWAAAAGVLGARDSLADEGPPETTTIRLRRDPHICVAPWLHRRGRCCGRKGSPTSATSRRTPADAR